MLGGGDFHSRSTNPEEKWGTAHSLTGMSNRATDRRVIKFSNLTSPRNEKEFKSVKFK